MDERQILRLYCGLMEEAKIRIGTINYTYRNDAKLPPMMVRESCYLQFRFLCEIIALGCLIAHSDVKEAHAVKDRYEPHKIMRKLEKLNPYFYPQPVERGRDADLNCTTFTTRRDVNHLSKNELLTLWGKAGDVLHRSPMVKFLDSEKLNNDDYSDIFHWSGKITGLLNSHWISLAGQEKALWVSLIAKETNKAAASILDFGAGNGSVSVNTIYVQ